MKLWQLLIIGIILSLALLAGGTALVIIVLRALGV
jgi:hypothetical protein